MNKWLYRAAGAVGVASCTLLLSSGLAHAETKTTIDPQAMREGVAEFFTPNGPRLDGREEFIGGLLGGGGGGGPLGGLTGGLGGLTGGKGGNSLLSGLTGGGDLLGSVTGTVTGGANPLGDLTGGLGGLAGGGDPLGSLTSSGPLSSLTGGLTDDGGPLKTVAGGLTGSLTKDDGALGAVTGKLTGKLLGAGRDTQAFEPALSDILTQDRLAAARQGPPSTDMVDAALQGTSIDTSAQRGIQLDPDTARQVSDATAPMVSAMIADAVAKRMGMHTGAAAGVDVDTDTDEPAAAGGDEENFPLMSELPLVGSLLGGESPLGNVVAVGDIHKGIPLVGPTLDGQFSLDTISKLPVVGSLLSNGLVKTGEGQGLPLVGNLPFLGSALGNLAAKAPAAPMHPGMLPPAGANLPPQTLPAPAAPAQAPLAPGARNLAPAATGNRAAAPAPAVQGPLHVGKHRATERPEITDPDYLESGSLPLVGSLTGGELPLIGPLLKGLPLVGGLL